jgi:hypothetical protein
MKKEMWILVDFTRFRHKIEDISGFREWILMHDNVLETSLVIGYTIKI